jgi:hypothetical protein
MANLQRKKRVFGWLAVIRRMGRLAGWGKKGGRWRDRPNCGNQEPDAAPICD